jgi:hypothetical protein
MNAAAKIGIRTRNFIGFMSCGGLLSNPFGGLQHSLRLGNSGDRLHVWHGWAFGLLEVSPSASHEGAEAEVCDG